MYLKALELRGFKSFPDKTRLEFERGVTAVVGPNGSGKSNISDAVRWVLGEMSPKSLRGSKMEDVIFAGTAGRSQTGFCEVSIIIDNAAGDLPNDAEEVKVTRKYYRSGDSEYRINEKPSRLKDIYELFLNTGIGREGYSVIGQGKIAEVLSQKSDERRHIFEEAAGISKYRYRKNDAEKKLTETDANLLRLTDIIGEVSSRLGPLEKDAENAKKYLVLADRKKELEVSIWLKKIAQSDTKAAELEQKFSDAKASYEEKQHEEELLEAALDGLFNKKQFFAQKAESTRTEIAELEEKKNHYENLRSLSENDISHHSERQNTLKGEIAFLTDTESVRLEKEKRDAEALAAQKEKALTDAKSAAENADAAVEKAENDYRDAEARIEQSSDALRRQNEKVTELKIREAAEKSSEKNETERRAFLSAEIEKATQELEQTYTYHEAALKRKAEAQAEKEQINRDLEEEKNNRQTLVKERDEYLQKKNEYAAAFAADTHRKETLAKMEALMEGYPGSVKAVLNAGELTGICGPVSKRLTVAGEYVTAIETALGASVSHIIVETEADAKAAMRFLKQTNAGRATFLPLTSVSGRPLSEPHIDRNPGFIGIASALVTFDEKYRPIAEYLLGRTIVADNIDSASVIARAYSFRYKVVTLDGQVVNAGGSYTGGSAGFKTGVLSRGADIASLQASIDDILKKTKLLNEKIEENRQAIAESEEFIESFRNDLASADASLYRSENDARLHKEHIDVCSERIKELNGQLDEFDEQKKQQALSALSAALLEAETQAQSLQNAHAELNSLADTAYELLQKAREKQTQCRVTLVSAEKDAENAQTEVQASEKKINETQKRLEALREELTAIENRLSGIAFDIEENKKALDETTALWESKKTELAEYLANATQAESDMTGKRDEQKDLLRDKEVFFELMTRNEAALAGCRAEYDTLNAKLFEEYALTFTAALELHLPEPTSSSASELTSVKAKIRALGPINVGAVDEYKETKERYDFMTGQINDLESAKKSLENVIRHLESDMKKLFEQAVTSINSNFGRVFAELFGGGHADIVITDPENILESGIEINVQPPGKMVKNISLLSGGEQAFTAIALYFAILEVNPAPFYIFDEIEAALDDVNVARFAAYVKRHSDTQFIVITHRRGTMEVADTMYGVTMQEKGVSTFLKVNIDDVEKKTGVKL